MPMWHCNFSRCRQAAVRIDGDCVLCNRHLCAKHIQPEFYDCLAWDDGEDYVFAAFEAREDRTLELFNKINTKALISRASELRGGMPCTVPDLEYDAETRLSVMGGMNYHIEITFNDGVQWMARIRQADATSPPPKVRDYIMKSEIATYMFLEKTKLPAPKLFDYAFEGDPGNQVGVCYMFIEKLPGTTNIGLIHDASNADKIKIMNQIADSYIELHKHPFKQLGSLALDKKPTVGPFTRDQGIDFERDLMRPIGPCSSLNEHRTSQLKLILDLTLRGEMYARRPIDGYLLHRYLLDLVPKASPKIAPTDKGKFFLKHADDKGDHILVDDHGNVTGIIDWEWAFITSPAIAFNSPMGFFDVGDFYVGENKLGEHEAAFAEVLRKKGRQDLADYVLNGKLQHRFNFLCGYDFNLDWDGFKGIFKGLRKLVDEEDGPVEWEEWKRKALEEYSDDVGLKKLLRKKK
ncbi:hypothetical protein PT974_00825 [Cladobotryum mycophilum]|uniref:Aminoglycoside phosphotransferase domain-containing protein n=1 Tax=Cladobotryum mycophilum TaxID=491253 RepID=A0ABR0T3D1_9HYPO